MAEHGAMGMAARSCESYADRAVQQLRRWPTLTVRPADYGSGRGLALSMRQIVHLHAGNEAEVYLTWPVAERMSEALDASGRVTTAAGDDWVRVQLDSDNDVALLISLVSVAIKANAPAAWEPHRRVASCPRAKTPR
jgi:hypothetical protein